MDEGAEGPGGPRWMRVAPVLAGIAVVLVFVGFMLLATEAHFVPQVVDLFVVCQYAKAMAEGHPFRYNPGEPPSTGSTSLVHTGILALAHALGARGEGLVAFAIAHSPGFRPSEKFKSDPDFATVARWCDQVQLKQAS